jgi:DNA-binding NarL/FixJ family response regulator
VDDNPAVLAQVVHALAGRFEITGTLPDGSTLDAAVIAQKPDVVVLDITLPGENGLAVARRFRAGGGTAPMVFLTVHSDPDYARAAFAAGGSAYVTKARLATDLIVALELALENGQFVSPGVGVNLADL